MKRYESAADGSDPSPRLVAETPTEHYLRVEQNWVHEAIIDGVLDPASPYVGLSESEVEQLGANPRFADMPLLVRLRTSQADGRTVLSARELLLWCARITEPIVLDANRTFLPDDIRDVFPLEGDCVK
jgi:hypothetical protein